LGNAFSYNNKKRGLFRKKEPYREKMRRIRRKEFLKKSSTAVRGLNLFKRGGKNTNRD